MVESPLHCWIAMRIYSSLLTEESFWWLQNFTRIFLPCSSAELDSAGVHISMTAMRFQKDVMKNLHSLDL